MSARRKKHAGGRPSLDLSEVRVLLPLPQALLDRATEAARAEGVSRAEWVRRAMMVRLAIGNKSVGQVELEQSEPLE